MTISVKWKKIVVAVTSWQCMNPRRLLLIIASKLSAAVTFTKLSDNVKEVTIIRVKKYKCPMNVQEFYQEEENEKAL